ncbi:unnamed protein product, partial [Rotaria socialis]
KQYIACQSPLKTTCEDFWDMVIQYGITKIVMLNHFEQFNQQNDSAHVIFTRSNLRKTIQLSF